jgi:hypothetical protein
LFPLTDYEKVALAALLKRAIDDDRYPLSPRIVTLRGILAKPEPAKPAPARYRRGGLTLRHEAAVSTG